MNFNGKTERRFKLNKGWLLFFTLLLIYNANVINIKYHESGDNLPVKYLAFSLIKEFNLDLDEYYPYLFKKYPYLLYNENVPYYLINTRGHYVHTQGPGGGILSFPIFFLASLFYDFSADSQIAFILTKLIASLLIALSAIFVYYGLKEIADEKIAFYISLVYSLCSCVWSISSQQMWQHTGSEFFLAMGIYFLLKGIKQRKFIAYSGFPLASAVVARPTNGIVFIILSIYVLHKYRDQLLGFISCAFVPLSFIMWYNQHYFGSIFIYGQLIYGPICALIKRGTPYIWSTPFLEGLTGVMFSPSRGLLVYSPVFIFSFLGSIYIWKKKEFILQKYLTIAALALICIACKWLSWWGGHTFGYRPVVDTVPFLSIFLIPVSEWIRTKKVLKFLFATSIIVSLCIQLIGAFLYDGSWDKSPDIDYNRQRLWSWRDSQIAYYIRRLTVPLIIKRK